jgi:hypothetical protein
MGELITLPFKQAGNLARDFGSARLDYPQTEITVHYTELKRLQASGQRFFRDACTIRKYSLPKRQQSEFVKIADFTESEMNKGPKARPTFPFFIEKKEMIDLTRILALFDRLEVPPDFQLDYFFNCLPNFMTGDGVYTLPVFYMRKRTAPPMPILVADMELDFKALTRMAMRRLEFEKSATGYFQMALLYKILVDPDGFINVNPVYDWEGILFPGKERFQGWLQNIASAISRVDYARLWDLDTLPAVWHAGGRTLVKFDVLEPNHGYFQHYCFFRADRIIDLESLSLVRIEPNVFF